MSEEQEFRLRHDLAAIEQKLAAPFELSAVHFRSAVVSGNRALAVPFVEGRAIRDRLNEVLGEANWRDEYEYLPEGSVVCRLSLRLGDEWIMTMEMGLPASQQEEEGRKAMAADALTRAAIRFGIGRYLCRLPAQWVEFDPQKQQFVRQPTLPAGKAPDIRGRRIKRKLSTQKCAARIRKNGTPGMVMA